MVTNVHLNYSQKKLPHYCESLILLDFSTFFGCSGIVYFNLGPIDLLFF